MPRIERVAPVPAPADEPLERVAYPSPGGAWTLVLRDPYEVGWAGELWSGGLDVSSQHGPVLGRPGEKRFRVSEDMRPWAPDGRTVTFVTGRPAIQLYRPEERSLLELPTGFGAPITVQWSPTMDRLLVATKSGGHLYDASGVHRGTAGWTIDRGESLHTHWTRWDLFFVVTREPDTEGGTGETAPGQRTPPGVPAPRRFRTRIASTTVRPAGSPNLSTWIRWSSYRTMPPGTQWSHATATAS